MTTQNKSVLHHYLGTGLILLDKNGKQINMDASVYNAIVTYGIDRGKPALHSMNRLTQPLENGEIPILELAKIATRQDWYINNDKCVNSGCQFSYQNESFILNSFHGEISVPAQLSLFQYLINNHLNVFNLPESEYIEKSTLKL